MCGCVRLRRRHCAAASAASGETRAKKERARAVYARRKFDEVDENATRIPACSYWRPDAFAAAAEGCFGPVCVFFSSFCLSRGEEEGSLI